MQNRRDHFYCSIDRSTYFELYPYASIRLSIGKKPPLVLGVFLVTVLFYGELHKVNCNFPMLLLAPKKVLCMYSISNCKVNYTTTTSRYS
jgi:hypothetical protein